MPDRRTGLIHLVLAVTTILSLAPAASAGVAYEASGSFLVGGPVDFLLLDSCGFPHPSIPSGITSQCVELPSGLGGLGFVVTGSDAASLNTGLIACFYTAQHISLGCGTVGDVPDRAEMVSINAFGGIDVQWTFSVFE